MNSQNPTTNTAAKSALTPELVKTITERVYALLLADLRMERERVHGLHPDPYPLRRRA